MRDVTRGWGASGRPLVCSRVGDTERRTRGAISRLKMFALVTIQTRSEDAQLVADKTLERKKDGTERARLEPRARAATSFDTPSSGGASVPSRIRPESTVRETPHPVSLALSSSTPSDARQISRGFANWRGRARRGRPEPDRARVAKYTERRARVPPLDVLRCAHLTARAVRSMRRARSRRPSSQAVSDWFAKHFRVGKEPRARFRALFRVSFFVRR